MALERPLLLTMPPDQQNAARRRVLVVDDHAPSAEMVAEILTLEGYEVRIAHSASEAIEQAQRFSPLVVILDIGLPDEDGFEVARKIKSRSELQQIRLIALSGYGQSQYPRRAREAGFERYLVKPVDLDELLALVRELVG
jgi:DNA-binding response OmpR family regulator